MRCRRILLTAALLVGTLLVNGCSVVPFRAPSASPAPPEGTEPSTLELTSTAFSQGAEIPEKYTCDGVDVSPPLSWRSPPEGTESLALIMDDPDAPMGTWVHWVVYDIPADRGSLSEGVPADEPLSDGSLQGKNGWQRDGYGGPCPPSGSSHRYVFTLYALDTELGLEAGATKGSVLDAMDGHVLAQGELIGTYTR